MYHVTIAFSWHVGIHMWSHACNWVCMKEERERPDFMGLGLGLGLGLSVHGRKTVFDS